MTIIGKVAVTTGAKATQRNNNNKTKEKMGFEMNSSVQLQQEKLSIRNGHSLEVAFKFSSLEIRETNQHERDDYNLNKYLGCFKKNGKPMGDLITVN